MDTDKPQNPNEKMTVNTRLFFNEIKPKLAEIGLNKDQQEKLIKVFVKAQQNIIEKRQKIEEVKETNHQLNRFLSIVSDNFNEIISSVKRKWWYDAKDIIITSIIMAALVYLSVTNHLEPTQTATLFGGIVGYLLGSSR